MEVEWASPDCFEIAAGVFGSDMNSRRRLTVIEHDSEVMNRDLKLRHSDGFDARTRPLGSGTVADWPESTMFMSWSARA